MSAWLESDGSGASVPHRVLWLLGWLLALVVPKAWGAMRARRASPLLLLALVVLNAQGADSNLVPISLVQGSGAEVAIQGRVHVEAVVTGLFTRRDLLDGFFIQEEAHDQDADERTSEGLFVYCRGRCPKALAVGDRVRVAGKAMEFFGMSQIRAQTISVRSSDNPLPSATPVRLPTRFGTADARAFEHLEGMLVRFDQALVLGEFYHLARFGQLRLFAGDRPYQFTQQALPSVKGYGEYLAALARRSILLDDDNNDSNDAVAGLGDEPLAFPSGGLRVSNRFRGGERIANLTGVMHWSWSGSGSGSAWRVRAVPNRFEYVFSGGASGSAELPGVDGRLRVVGANLLNYFTTIDRGGNRGRNVCGPQRNRGCRGADSNAERVRQQEKIVAALLAMDAHILGLVEIENDMSESLGRLVGGLNAAAGDEVYAFIDTGFIGGDAIKVGLVYQRDFVVPIGDFAILTSGVDADFSDSRNRPVLVQSFAERSTGERLTVAVAHLKSKGASCDDDPDRFDGQGNCALTRAAAAGALARFLAAGASQSGDPDVLIIGDLNAYSREDAIRRLEDAGYVNLVARFVPEAAYSYVFDGQLGYLDHALASSSLAPQVASAAIWHVNSDEPAAFDYNDAVQDAGERYYERKPTSSDLYDSTPRRFSDHDPILIGINLEHAGEACGTGTHPLRGGKGTVSRGTMRRFGPTRARRASPLLGGVAQVGARHASPAQADSPPTIKAE